MVPTTYIFWGGVGAMIVSVKVARSALLISLSLWERAGVRETFMRPAAYIFGGAAGRMNVRLRIPNPKVGDPNLADETLVGLPDILRVTHAQPTARNPNAHERKRIINDEVRRVTHIGWLRLYGDRGVAGDHGNDPTRPNKVALSRLSRAESLKVIVDTSGPEPLFQRHHRALPESKRSR